jgi:mRNA interferase MazF
VTERVPGRGEVWLADPAHIVGYEQLGRRPVLVVSADRLNHAAVGTWALSIVVPFTTREREIDLHVRVQPPEGGLRQPSVLLPEQVSAFDQRRLLERWGRVSEATLLQVADRLRVVLDL